jgi:hypothetical protein
VKRSTLPYEIFETESPAPNNSRLDTGLMRQLTTQLLCFAIVASGFLISTSSQASAQYPVYAAPAQPAVVGYSAQRRGLFGRRVVYRPVVAPVAAVAPVAVARPVIAAPVTSNYAPPVAAPVTSYYAPPVAVAPPVVAAPVTSYYAPPVPVAAPVTTYRAPIRTYYRAPIRTYYRAPIRTYRVPVWGF